jgi:hypothetical protein
MKEITIDFRIRAQVEEVSGDGHINRTILRLPYIHHQFSLYAARPVAIHVSAISVVSLSYSAGGGFPTRCHRAWEGEADADETERVIFKLLLSVFCMCGEDGFSTAIWLSERMQSKNER